MVGEWLNSRLKNPVVLDYNVRMLDITMLIMINLCAHILINMQSPAFSSSLLKCMTEGAAVVITQVNVTDMSSNRLCMDVLRSKSLLYLAKSIVKINVRIHTKCTIPILCDRLWHCHSTEVYMYVCAVVIPTICFPVAHNQKCVKQSSVDVSICGINCHSKAVGYVSWTKKKKKTVWADNSVMNCIWWFGNPPHKLKVHQDH